jgi:hypothetical protein
MLNSGGLKSVLTQVRFPPKVRPVMASRLSWQCEITIDAEHGTLSQRCDNAMFFLIPSSRDFAFAAAYRRIRFDVNGSHREVF